MRTRPHRVIELLRTVELKMCSEMHNSGAAPVEVRWHIGSNMHTVPETARGSSAAERHRFVVSGSRCHRQAAFQASTTGEQPAQDVSMAATWGPDTWQPSWS